MAGIYLFGICSRAAGVPDLNFPGRGPVTGVIEKFTNFLANWRDAIVRPE
jgi:hypothetical protein